MKPNYLLRSGLLISSVCIIGFFAGCSSEEKATGRADSSAGHEGQVDDHSGTLDEEFGDGDTKATATTQKQAAPQKSNQREDVSLSYSELGKGLDSNNENQLGQAAVKILANNQNDVKALNALGIYHYKNGHLGLAKIIFQRALELDKANAGLHNNLALVYLKEGDQDLAIESFKRAVSLDPNNRIAGGNLGSIYLRYGNFQKASGYLEKAFEGDRKDESLANNYGLCLRALKEYDEAEKILEPFVSRSRNPFLLFNYAELLVENKKDIVKARQTLNKIRVLSTDTALMKDVDNLLKKIEPKT